jgi:hypothetical protein
MKIAAKTWIVILFAAVIAVLSGCASNNATVTAEPVTTAQSTEASLSETEASDTAAMQATATASAQPAPPTPEYVFSEQEIIEQIIELVGTQETAIRTADSELMATTIDPMDTWLMLEARHLAADQKVSPVENYTRSVSDISYTGYYYQGTLEQHFIFEGDERSSSELRYFIFQDGKAYDAGTALEKASSGQVFISFPDGEYDFAMQLADTTNEYVAAINDMWSMYFSDTISIKVYDSKEVFLYSAKLSMPGWVGGWYERGESIKTYLYDTSLERYQYLMRHEATHMMLADATNDNAAYWMQEGFATTMPGYAATGKLAINRESTVRQAMESGRLPTLAEHTAASLESMTDSFDVQLYYGYSSAMVVYLIEHTDDDTLIELFDELRTYPYISLTLSEKAMDAEAITEKCIKKATGLTLEEFYSGFDEWLEARLS